MDSENFARFPYQNFDFQRFQGAAGVGPYMSLLTDEQEQRGSSFISQIFPSQIINEEPSSRFNARRRNGYLKRANNLIDVFGIKDKIVTGPGCDRV